MSKPQKHFSGLSATKTRPKAFKIAQNDPKKYQRIKRKPKILQNETYQLI